MFQAGKQAEKRDYTGKLNDLIKSRKGIQIFVLSTAIGGLIWAGGRCVAASQQEDHTWSHINRENRRRQQEGEESIDEYWEIQEWRPEPTEFG